MLVHVLESQTLTLLKPAITEEAPERVKTGIATQFHIINQLLEAASEHGVKVEVERLTREPAVKLDYSSEYSHDPFFSVKFRIPVIHHNNTASGGENGPYIAAAAFNAIRDFCDGVNRTIEAEISIEDEKEGNALSFASKARDLFGGLDLQIQTHLGERGPSLVRKETVKDAVIIGCEYNFLQDDTKYAYRGDDAAFIELSVRFYGNVQ